MSPQGTERRLAAILAADVAGYSRLMGEDEVATVRTLRSYRKVIDRLVGKHRGRVFGGAGDSVVAEFGSALAAVRCAVDIQREIEKRSAAVDEHRRMRFRIGVNLGDVTVEGDNLLGDGINVASRLEGLAEPGGVCISGAVFSQVRNRLDLGFADLGAQKVKNIAEPVQTYKVVLDPSAAGTFVAAKRKLPTWWRWAAPATAAAFVVVLAALAWWRPWVPTVEPASVANMVFPLPKEPSIAVLPFDNLTGDKTQDYLSYGMAGKITAKLAKVSDIFVITRPAAFSYYRRKKKLVKASKVAENLGVRHVLMGSVQKSGDKLRVTVQLVDAVSGRQMWADQYDGVAGDIFALQDKIARKVIAELEVKLTVGEQARIWRKQTTNLDAYNLFMRGLFHYQRRTRPENAQAQKIFKQVVRMDPNFAEAQCLLGFTHLLKVRFDWSKDPRADLARAEELARKAIAKDPDYPHAYALLGSVSLRKRRHDHALAQARKALELEPHYANNIAFMALIQMNAGQPTEALGTIRRAMRLYPYYPGWYLWVTADSYRQLGKYDEAIRAAKEWRERRPRSWLPPALLAATRVQAGRIDEARKAVRQLRERRPKLTTTIAVKVLAGLYKNPQDAVRIKEALLKAGLPE